jgi:putative flippase GtrA
VTVLRGLYVRFRQLIHEFAKFGIIGVIGLFITNAGYVLLHSHGVGPVTSTTIATIIATTVAYIGNRYWSFAHRERTSVPREGLIFFVLNGVGLLIQDAVVAFNSYVLHLEHHKLAEFLALNIGIAIATLFRFWSYRKFVWAAPAGDGDARATAQLDAEHLGQAVAGVPLVSENGHAPDGNGHALDGNGHALDGNGHALDGNGHAPGGHAAHKDSFSPRKDSFSRS